MWSLGNESWKSINFTKNAAWIHACDPTRLTTYEFHPEDPEIDVVSGMYFSISSLFTMLDHDHRLRLITEYDYAVDNGRTIYRPHLVESGIIERYANWTGAFIWSYKDMSLYAYENTTGTYHPYIAAGHDWGTNLSAGEARCDRLEKRHSDA